MTTKDQQGDTVADKKRTMVMTNSVNIAEMFRRAQSDGSHRQEPLIGGKAKACEVYRDRFVELICEGVKKELDDVKWFGRIAEKLNIGEIPREAHEHH